MNAACQIFFFGGEGHPVSDLSLLLCTTKQQMQNKTITKITRKFVSSQWSAFINRNQHINRYKTEKSKTMKKCKNKVRRKHVCDRLASAFPTVRDLSMFENNCLKNVFCFKIIK